MLNEETILEYLYGGGVGEQVSELLKANKKLNRSSNFYRQLNRYITYGCINNALLPFSYENCGSNYFIPEERGEENVKRGRKTMPAKLDGHPPQPVFSKSPGITKKEIRRIRKVARTAIRSVRKNITARARLMYRRENECRFVDEETPYGTNKKLVWNDDTECLSDGQFRRQFQKFLSEEDKIVAAKGQVTFDKDYADRRVQFINEPERRDIWRKLFIGQTTENIADTMGISVGAVEQILSCYPELVQLRKKIRYFNKRQKHRQNLIKSIHKYTTRKGIRANCSASYIWLYKHDHDWLYSTLPEAIPRQKRYLSKEEK